MKKKLKKALIILGSILLIFLLIGVIATLLFYYQKPLIKGIVEKQIEKRTGIHVTIGTLDYELFPLRIEADEIDFTTLLDETKVDVNIQKIILKGDFHRIRKKMKPYFETIEAEGVRIVSDIKEARKKIAIQDILRGLSSGMSFVQKISIQNSSFELIFSEQKLILQGGDITLSPSESLDAFAYTLLFRYAEGIGRPQPNRFRNSIQGSGTLSVREKPSLDGRFVLTSNHIAYAGKQEYFEKIALNFDGEFDGDKKTFSFPTFEIEIPSLAYLTGPLDIVSLDELTLFFRPSLRIDDLGRIFSLAKDQLPLRLEKMDLNGSALFEGEARITPEVPEKKALITGLVVLNPTKIKYRTSEYQLDSQFSGSFELDGYPDNRDISGRLKIAKGSFAGKALKASDIEMDIPFVYDSKKFKIDYSKLKATAVALSMQMQDRTFKTESPSFSGQGFIDLKKRSFQISEANILLPPFPPFEVKAQAGFGPHNSNSFSLESSQIAFQTLMDFFPFAIPQEVIDWEPRGQLKFYIEAQDFLREKQKVWELSVRLETFDVQFHDASFTVAGESLKPKLTLEGTYNRDFEDIVFAAKMEFSQGESLWKDFYVDWSKMPVLGTISGRFHFSRRKFTDLSIGASIPEFGKITASGYLDLLGPVSADLKITASELQLSPLYAFINQKRSIDRTKIKLHGEAESQIDVKITKNHFSVVGNFRVKDASWIDENEDIEVRGIEAKIPVHYKNNFTDVKEEIAPPKRGSLTFQKFRSSSLDIKPLTLDITSARNGYSIQPFETEIFGFKAHVGETSVEYGFNPWNLRAQTSFTWKDEDMSQLPFTSQDFRLEGTLSVNLPVVEIYPDRLITEGQGEAETFGGKITIENIQAVQPFSKNRTISCDVKLSGLDLEKITDSIPFGRVTGIINGEIKDLALAYGQPERFNIRIESEKRKGVPQRFSLKATNDLAILGTGEKTPFSPQSGWTRIVKDFRYRKIGMACSLNNDMFTLRGTIHGDGVEYLVRGSGLFAINVVNKQARNQIQFKDMLNRLKRIGESKQSP
jgi:hypothetical protein